MLSIHDQMTKKVNELKLARNIELINVNAKNVYGNSNLFQFIHQNIHTILAHRSGHS